MHLALSLSSAGSGHSTRVAALGRVLAQRHRLSVWSAGAVRPLLRRHLPGAEFHALPAVREVCRNNVIDKLGTVRVNSGRFWNAGGLVRALARRLRRHRVDGVIADYEPFLPRAAIRCGLPTVLFNHQGVVNRHPELSADWLAARAANALMMPGRARAAIVSSFYDGDVGPLLRPEIIARTPTRGRYVCVYARPAFRELILPVLERFPRESFMVLPRPGIDLPGALADCRGVIAPAGHQLMSEALYLGKPLLVFPQAGQYEQALNARMLVRSGWGIAGRLDRAGQSVAGFLDRLHAFPLRAPDPKVHFRFEDDSERAARLIEQEMVKAIARAAVSKRPSGRALPFFQRAG